ncbi:hypothetical protein ARTSIC4J27_384 [Pseudarthrobacter siccitolerans]|uniref:Uncharacterized protein n=1 Tax=Pseudarthrobacter siccitolerans TaxID=861266 RepID=A0A024GXL3_9MICC|nr:hypothetical protein ARTSIC4J27_384 [Pseudarthrobacter siccitolerans]
MEARVFKGNPGFFRRNLCVSDLWPVRLALSPQALIARDLKQAGEKVKDAFKKD